MLLERSKRKLRKHLGEISGFIPLTQYPNSGRSANNSTYCGERGVGIMEKLGLPKGRLHTKPPIRRRL
jgi:hypothetical protein